MKDIGEFFIYAVYICMYRRYYTKKSLIICKDKKRDISRLITLGKIIRDLGIVVAATMFN